MSLEELKKEILSQARKQARAVTENAGGEQEKILAEARARAKAIIAEQEELGRTQAKELALELKASALLQAKRMESDAKEEVVQSVLAEARNELARVAHSPRYEKVFGALARQAIKALGEKEFVLKTSARDKKLGAEYGKVVETIDCIGGVVVARADGRIQINNTFEALLEEREEELKQKAFEELFGRKREKPAAVEAKAKPAGKKKKK